MIDLVRGVVLRCVGLGARLGLLACVLPRLAPGELSRYLLLTTAATLLGRLLALGLEDELPLVVRGDVAIARRLRGVSLWPLAGAAVATGGALAAGTTTDPGAALAVAAAALTLLGTLVLVGLLRTLPPHLYERVLNAPPVLHLGAALALPGIGAADLVLLGAAAQGVVALWVGATAGLHAGRPSNGPDVRLRSRLRGGAGKLTANLLLIGQVRALGWLPALLAEADDALSFGVLVAEAGLQLAQVGVQRHFAAYARGEGHARLAARRGLIAWCVLGLAGVVVAALGAALAPAVGRDLGPAGWALVQAGALTATLEARYFGWSRGLDARPQLAIQLVWVLVVAGVVATLPAARWLPVTTAATALLAVAALISLLASSAASSAGRIEPCASGDAEGGTR